MKDSVKVQSWFFKHIAGYNIDFGSNMRNFYGAWNIVVFVCSSESKLLVYAVKSFELMFHVGIS